MPVHQASPFDVSSFMQAGSMRKKKKKHTFGQTKPSVSGTALAPEGTPERSPADDDYRSAMMRRKRSRSLDSYANSLYGEGE